MTGVVNMSCDCSDIALLGIFGEGDVRCDLSFDSSDPLIGGVSGDGTTTVARFFVRSVSFARPSFPLLVGILGDSHRDWSSSRSRSSSTIDFR